MCLESGTFRPLAKVNGPFARFLLHIHSCAQAITDENEAYVDVTILSFPFVRETYLF